MTTLEEARFAQLRSLTELPAGPQESALAALQQAGAQRLGALLSPTGRALGVWAWGRGEPFARAVQTWLTELTDPATGKLFLSLAHFTEFRHLRVEMVLGSPNWLMAGVEGLTQAQVRGILGGEGVPDDVAIAATPSTHSYGLYVYTDGKRGSTLLVSHGIEGQAADLGKLTQQHLLKWPDAPWLRSSAAPAGLQLIDWQVAHDIASGAPRRIGLAAGITESTAPLWVGWRKDALSDTVVYAYPLH